MRMHDEDLEPGVITYNEVVSECEKGAPSQVSIGRLVPTQEGGLEPDVTTYNSSNSNRKSSSNRNNDKTSNSQSQLKPPPRATKKP